MWNEKGRTDHISKQYGFDLFYSEYDAAIKEMSTKIDILAKEFEVRNDYSPIHHVEQRLKTPDSIDEKLRRLDLPVTIADARDNIFDIAGLRIICNFVDDVYQVAELLTSQDDIEVLVEKDYIKEPKENGYRSLHYRLTVPVFFSNYKVIVPCEVQIRTVAMDFWASLEHNLRYKQNNEGKMSDKVNMELKACAEVSANLDKRMQKIFDEVKK